MSKDWKKLWNAPETPFWRTVQVSRLSGNTGDSIMIQYEGGVLKRLSHSQIKDGTRLTTLCGDIIT